MKHTAENAALVTMDICGLVDVMCPEHVEQAQHRWPVLADLRGLLDTCHSCKVREIARSCMAPPPGFIARSFRDLDDEAWREITAYHEAAHAVVGVLTGHPLREVVVATARNAHPAGWVTWGRFDVPAIDHLAMLAAGQEAMISRLAEAGLVTIPNLVAARYVGWDDNIHAERWTTKYGLAPDAGHQPARDLLGQHWDTVGELALRLHNEHRVSGEDVHATLGVRTP